MLHKAKNVDELLRANQLITALSRVAARVDTACSPEEVIETLGRELSQMDIICFVALNDPNKRSLTVTYTSIAPKIQSITKTLTGKEISGFHLTPDTWPLYIQVIEQKQTIFRNNLKSILFNIVPDVPQFVINQILKLLGIKKDASVIHVPLQVEEQVLGALILWGTQIFEADLSVFSVFASQVAAALKNARLLAQVSKSEARFRGLFESAPDAIVIVDENGRISLINRQAEDLFGYPRHELINQSIEILIPKSVRKSHIKKRVRYISHPQNRQMSKERNLSAQHKNGRQFPVEISLTPLESGKKTLILSTIRDITWRKNRKRELELLNKVLTAAATKNNQEEILQEGCAAIANFFAVSQVALALLNETNEFETVVAEHLDPGRPSAMNIKIPVATNPALHDVLQSGKPVAINDIKTHPVTASAYDILKARGTASLLIVPIQVKGQVVGSLGIDAISSRTFTEQEITMAQIVAKELGRALETAQLYEQLQTHAADLELKVEKRTRELKKANERLQELDKLKSKLVSDVSHELRTPITALSMYLDLLDRGKPERRDEYLQILRSETKRISRLVEDILDLSRLEMTRNREIGMDMIDLNEIVAQVVTVHLPRAEAENLTLRFAPHENLPFIYGERNQIAQVVTNLIANALNYTQIGTIQVFTCASEQGDIYLQVEDTGMGIATDDLPHIFERFYRGEQQGASTIPGTGLGLGIVREIVNLHQGEIAVESKVGEGSKFRVIFPRPHKSPK